MGVLHRRSQHLILWPVTSLGHGSVWWNVYRYQSHLCEIVLGLLSSFIAPGDAATCDGQQLIPLSNPSSSFTTKLQYVNKLVLSSIVSRLRRHPSTKFAITASHSLWWPSVCRQTLGSRTLSICHLSVQSSRSQDMLCPPCRVAGRLMGQLLESDCTTPRSKLTRVRTRFSYLSVCRPMSLSTVLWITVSHKISMFIRKSLTCHQQSFELNCDGGSISCR